MATRRSRSISRRSADSELFLLHDDTLERMAGVNQEPEALTSQQLSKLKLRNRDGFELHSHPPRHQAQPEVIACARAMGVDQQVNVWGDLKTPADFAWIREAVEPHGVLFMAKTRLEAPDADSPA